ncbi:MAG: lytic transglycosylase domain-containing protein [Ferrovibrio sp.]|uniref:lytic transglycosylase domain-containing protein n=1 Tax=Ferrovibrio sp. TaxID=1917215 RepID=UPI00262BE7B7|nr:lytic transglycosylase domain-containing protein [Ferrovibrio sp.]MCW0234820.1 lytic transglycosylase domain-containing protein [Ferrovibrio sp.]
MRLGGLILACGLLLTAVMPVRAQETTVELPGVLGAADIDRYQRIFDFQAEADWARADREIARLGDKLLLGHVLQQRYLHPTAYNAGYPELLAWLKQYRDHAGAEEVYGLAMRKKPRKDKAPPAPLGVELGDYDGDPGLVATTRRRPQPRDRDPAHARAISQAAGQFASLLKRDRLDEAAAFLAKPEIRSKVSASEYDEWRKRLAWLYVLEGNDARALELAAPAAQRSRARVPDADWIAGLSAWRLGRYDNAAHHFENLAFSKTATAWDRSAGAWWGARVMLRLRQPSEAIRLLEVGANEERTFYGQLSLAQLGTDQPFSWAPPPLSPDELRRLKDIPAIRRAIALSEVGEAVRADREVTRLFSQASDDLASALLGLVSRMQAPASTMRIAIAWYNVKGESHDHALYPLPPWEPDGGFSVDRALVFAFMRQESAFNARAMSSAGATGLMQLMPRTAGAVAGDKSLRSKNGRHKLFAPEYNIELGQRYLQHLLDMPMIKGNLFHLAAAYNGGPGNLQKWIRANPDMAANDPFLFIETIPLSETRIFVQRVLTNYWIYRSRIGQPDTSLSAAMTGEWPQYRGFDRGDQRAEKKN